MTPGDVAGVVGPSVPSQRRSYAGGTKSWSYRYDDHGVKKLLHVIFQQKTEQYQAKLHGDAPG